MKGFGKAIIFALALVLVVSCTQYVYIPIGIPDNGDGGPGSHTHTFGERPSGYDLKAGRVYEIYECECGETKENALGTAETTLDLTGEVTEDELSAIGEGMVLITDNDNAQAVLDHIRSGCVVYFTAGTYMGTPDPAGPEGIVRDPQLFRIRPSRYNGTVVKLNGAQGSWEDGEELTEINDEVAAALTGTNDYILNLENIRLIGDDEAVFEVGFEIKATHIYQTPTSYPYDAVREKYLQTATVGGYYAKVCIDGLAFENMDFVFENDVYFIDTGYYDSESYLRNLSIHLCSFACASGVTPSTTSVHLITDIEGMYEDIIITDSSFSNMFQGVFTQGVNNMSIEDCNFASTGSNAIAIQSGSSNSFSGNINLLGNTFTDIGDRPIRFGNGSNADIFISDNDFGTCTNANNHILKSETLSGCSGEFVNNLYKGSVMPRAEFSITDSSWIVEIPQ